MTRQIRVSCNPNFPDRRAFLTTSVAGGLLSAALPMAVRGDTEKGAAPPAASDPSFELSELSIDELQEGMKLGRFTARSLTEKYLARIEAVDKSGPALRSVIEVNPDALTLADEADRQRKAGVPRGPLHGIPVLVKDNIDTADKMATTAGSLALVGAKPPEDSFVVKQLRKAGAVLLGKTNLSEWANIRSSHSTSGWSGRGGLTRNPYALDRNPCGSSSGSGAAVAANLCAVAVGTETDGSILSPSSVCGIVGIKPTIGLVSRTGIVPISHSQDTAGPMTRTVRDAAILLGVLAGIDPQDAVTSESKDHAKSDYTQFLDAAGLKGAKIGVARNYFSYHDAAGDVMKTALEAMKQAGAELIDTSKMTVAEESGSSEGTVLRYELKADMAAYLARLGPEAPVKSLKDIIEFNNRNKETELRYFGQNIFESAEGKGPLTDYQYVEELARCRRLARTEGIDAAIDEHKLNAIVAPTIGPACMSDLVNGDRWLGGSTSPAAVAGYPSITVPAGFVFGLPVGISFFGRAWSEPVLLKLAYVFEQATKHRKVPRFLATAALDA
ncbi:MAG TPA: amidase [Lacipirellulaceae bacterium]|nr:amidase [Lacipirellulaceae bacterium]